MSADFEHSTHLASDEQTTLFAARLAPLLRAGDTLLLHGSVGAGKTHFARGLIQSRLQAAGLYEDVPSPTFTLVQTYWDGTTDLWHADLYRLVSPEDLVELGLDGAFENAICLVEWPDRLGNWVPQDALHVSLETVDHPSHRILRLSGPRSFWADRLAPALCEEAAADE